MADRQAPERAVSAVQLIGLWSTSASSRVLARRQVAFQFQGFVPATASATPPYTLLKLVFNCTSIGPVTVTGHGDLDKVRGLPALGKSSKEDMDAVSAMLDAPDKDEPIPDYEETARKLRSGQNLVGNLTIGEWLDRWQNQESHRRATELSYESHVRLYLQPKIGDVRVDRLTVSHISEMFAKINDDNDRIKNTRVRTEKRVLRAQLDEMAPFQRPVGPSSQARIHATLRSAMNDAIAE